MNENSQQIDSALNICVAPDQPLKRAELRDVFLSYLSHNQNFILSCDPRDKRVVSVDCVNGSRHRFCLAAVTFLGGVGNHPIFKKRIQLKDWYKEAYYRLTSEGCTVHFMGIYHYEHNIVFVDFVPDTYVQRKMHNSSAFVYINDLFRAMQDGVASRIDFHGNKIITIRANELSRYLQGNQDENINDDSELFDVFDNFNRQLSFDTWLMGTDIIHKMYHAKWPKWRETEWAGWYIEFELDSFLKKINSTNVFYKNERNKKLFSWDYDFDLLFPKHKFYGDLKASDCKNKDLILNDKENVFCAISRYGRLWYVIYEHETVKDVDCGGEVCKMRYSLLCNDPNSNAKSPTSYITRMKNRVNFRRMMILELNRANCNDLLKDFHQGRQPSGDARALKVLITKQNIENFQVFYYQGKDCLL